jgi:3-isopropylmalate dehydrogenase
MISSMNTEKKVITILPGDGIGTEVVAEACKILQLVARQKNFPISLNYGLIGGAALDGDAPQRGQSPMI